MNAGGLKIIGKARHEGRLRADHDEVDMGAAAERDHRAVVAWIDGDALRQAADSGISRRRVELGEERRGGQRPRQRMFAAARPDQEHVHRKRRSSLR
jgi:hypothetical protein